MIKVFRVYQNHSNIASYINKWICDKSSLNAGDILDFEMITVCEDLIEISDKMYHASDRVFVYKFKIDGDYIILFARYAIDNETKNLLQSVNNVISDITQYIRLNYKNEMISGNLTRLLTQFLANYFKKFEEIVQKKRKIYTLKQGLDNVKDLASQTFMTIVERGKAIGELQTEIDTISHHGHVFNSRTKRLKDKMWSHKVKSYLFSIMVLFGLIMILYVLF